MLNTAGLSLNKKLVKLMNILLMVMTVNCLVHQDNTLIVRSLLVSYVIHHAYHAVQQEVINALHVTK